MKFGGILLLLAMAVNKLGLCGAITLATPGADLDGMTGSWKSRAPLPFLRFAISKCFLSAKHSLPQANVSVALRHELRAITLPFCPISRGVLPSLPLLSRTICPGRGRPGINNGRGLGISEVFCRAVRRVVPGCLIGTHTEFLVDWNQIETKGGSVSLRCRRFSSAR
ncbi:MAG: hypothetical protein H6Q41_272 [Deltaproteobacteria bacterium]|nr:hypothetical protein [Deltaproteobacteria bacterium]